MASTKKKSVKKKAVKKKVATKKSQKAKTDEFGLNLKQREFADLYRGGQDDVRGNAKRCYMETHPRAGEKTAECKGSLWVGNDKIDAYLKAKSEEIAEECDYNAKKLLKRLVDEAEADLADLYDENGGLKSIHEWPKIFRQGLVAGLDVEQQFIGSGKDRIPDGYILKVKLSDRAKRLEMLGKHVDVQAFEKEKIDVGLTIVIEDKDAQA